MIRPRIAALAAFAALVLAGCGDSSILSAPPSSAPGTEPSELTTAAPRAATPADGAGQPATMVRTVDGDTIRATVSSTGVEEYVRLLTISAPELRKRNTPADDECGAQPSTDALASQLPAGTPLTLLPLPGEPDRDRYGRLLRVVYADTPDPALGLVNLNLTLTEQGWARHYDRYPTVQSDATRAAQERARAADLGNWATCPDWKATR